MDKKAAEEQARTAKENTGRALFESGKWRDDDESEGEDEDDDVWNLQKLRTETEKIREKTEEERLVAAGLATPATDSLAENTPTETQTPAEPATAS